MWQFLVDNIKTAGACVTGIAACIGGYAAMDGPIPASVKYVDASTQSVNKRVIDTQLQLNTIQRNQLRKEKFDREYEMQRDPTSPSRGVLHERVDKINDELDTIEKEREELRKEKAGSR